MRALVAYERGLCSCGFHSSLTEDPSNAFAIEEDRCPVCARAAQYARVQADNDERAAKARGENAPANVPRPEDGRRTWLRRMTPDEVKKRRAVRAEKRGRA